MGVRRITTLLNHQGWLPTSHVKEGEVDAACRLWKDWTPSMAADSQNGLPIQQIPEQSTLLIDGNGLAFYLFKVAYARHLKSLFRNPKDSSSFPSVKSLTTSDVTKSLPSMMPLLGLEDITREFTSHLGVCNFQVQVFWDGPKQRFKTVTAQKRRERRQEQWSNLQQYCEHGSLPKSKSVFDFLNHFPLPGLFLQSVRKTLDQEQVDMVYCEEEADVELAQKASGDSTAYVLGQDSDFYFFKNVQYVPFDCIFTANGSLHACIGRRQDLARLLGIEDEEMTELAILLGNDYIHSLKVPKKKGANPFDPLTVIDYLNQQDEGFQVKSAKYESELAFVRALYNLQDLNPFPFQEPPKKGLLESDEDEEVMEHLKIAMPESLTSMVESLFDEGRMLTLAEIVQRCLSFCAGEHLPDNGKPSLLRLEHLDAYDEMMFRTSANAEVDRLDCLPEWTDVRASYIIEKCILCIFNSPRASLPLKIQTSSLHRQYTFHCIMASKKVANEGIENDVRVGQATTVKRQELPIDSHEGRIIQNIAENRVTIIHGETGCGKSSRVPVMLLNAPSPEPSLPHVKIFVSQPRRIAVKGLVERLRSCEPDHRQKFAIRMGHGLREYENNHTQVWCATTGYLTRLLANHPERFDHCTHIMIDEVHERSVDTDILCLLCRRLLERNKTIRLVLMSATLATKVYKDYFSVPNDPIHVGVRTFPISEYYAEDLHRFKLPPTETKTAKEIVSHCGKNRCNSAPDIGGIAKRCSLAAHLAKAVGRPGTSVLIFVPGMNEIVIIAECIDNFSVAGRTFVSCPIHSDIPFEEQMEAFKEPQEDEVKIIIATNAAESSVTLPAVDHVICLGLCRQIIYNADNHRQILAPMWISQASAKQRAGRTGRVRPGSVYRLYTKEAFQSFMDEFDPGEMGRIPLDSVILMLKEMLHEEVIPVLGSCIDPPHIDTIDRSFESLYRSNFLEQPNDKADITTLGSFVSSMGVDLALGSLIGLGIQFGVAAEAIEMAAMMAFPKTPFQITNTLFHDPPTFNEITSSVYKCRCHFDANLYSEPMSLMNAVYDYDQASDKSKWCWHYRIAVARMKQLANTRKSLRSRVARYFGINEEILIPENPPVMMHHAKINILRILQVWVFSDTIVERWPTKSIKLEKDGSLTLSARKGDTSIEEHHLKQVLDPTRHPHEIIRLVDLRQSGHFKSEDKFDLKEFMPAFQIKLVSYMIEMHIDLVCCFCDKNLFIFTGFKSSHDKISNSLFQGDSEHSVAEDIMVAEHDSMMKRHGYLERKCGTWKVHKVKSSAMNTVRSGVQQKLYKRLHVEEPSKEFTKSVLRTLESYIDAGEIKSFLYWNFQPTKGKKKKKKTANPVDQNFELIGRGRCQAISDLDLKDLLASAFSSISKVESKTKIRFFEIENQPYLFKDRAVGKDPFKTTCNKESTSWKRPLFKDIPEGARILSVLASCQRRGGHRLRFAKFGSDGDALDTDPEDTDDIWLDRDLSIGWGRLGKAGEVFVPEDTVAASATSTTGPLYACCSNTLEIKSTKASNMLKVEGMTLLPSNPVFLLLSMLTFGLRPYAHATRGDTEGEETKEAADEEEISAAIQWLHKQNVGLDGERVREQIKNALSFHDACENMGKSLHSFTDRIVDLCNLFSHVDGHEMTVWNSLDDQEFSVRNLSKWRADAKRRLVRERKEAAISPDRPPKNRDVMEQKAEHDSKSIPNSSNPRGGLPDTSQDNNVIVSSSQKRPSKASNCWNALPATDDSSPKACSSVTTSVEGKAASSDSIPQGARGKLRILQTFDPSTIEASRHWFDVTMIGAQDSSVLQSSNILALIHQTHAKRYAEEVERSYSISLSSKAWKIYAYTNSKGKVVYQARFVDNLIPILSCNGRGQKQLHDWITKSRMRPSTVVHERECLPPDVTPPNTSVITLSKNRRILMYESIEVAVKMEAAFWLECQFVSESGAHHWYQHKVAHMMKMSARAIAKSRKPPASTKSGKSTSQ